MEAIIQMDLMDDCANYLGRGRAFQNESKDGILAKWIAEVRSAIADVQRGSQTLRDLGAEIHIRGETPPYNLIPEELKQVRADIEKDPENPQVREHIDRLMAQLRSRKKN